MKRFSFSAVLALWSMFFAVTVINSQQQKPAKQQAVSPPVKGKSGEQIFNDNCLRCHTPPMALSPRITGTVIMHMRTRARLSQEDQERLLKYLAP
jgi:cytochrome c5